MISVKSKWLLRLLGILVLLIILSRIDLDETAGILAKVDLTLLVPSMSLLFPIILIKAVRWKFLMKTQGIEYKTKDSFADYFAGFFIGAATPGNMGELIKIKFIVDKGYSYGKASVSVIVDRIFDVLFLFGSGLIGLLFFFGVDEVMPLLLLIPLAIIVWVFRRQLVGWSCRAVPGRYRSKVERIILDFRKDLSLLSRRALIIGFLLTLLSMLIYFIHAYMLALSIGIDLPFFYLAASVSITALVTIIPISFVGVGTRDAALVLLFSRFNISQEVAIAFSTLILLRYALSSLVGFPMWLRKGGGKK